MSLDLATLLGVLRGLPKVRRYRVAYSGGVDSHVLLHALAELRPRLDGIPLEAVHVNHQLCSQAADWEEHCRGVCRDLAVPFTAFSVEARPRAGESREAAARAARYSALGRQMAKGDGLLTAHQRDDQAETLLLQLLRGAGVRGLAAMPRVSSFAGGWLLRPLLGFARQDLLAYAERKGLVWVDDASNADTLLDRNFLRHSVLPTLETRWPQLAGRLARTARHCAEAQSLLDERARADLAGLQPEEGCLSVASLSRLEPARLRNLLRTWLLDRGLRAPSTVTLERILTEVLAAGADRTPYVHWAGGEVRRFRDGLYAMEPLPRHDPDIRLAWDLKAPVALPGGGGRIRTTVCSGGGLSPRSVQRAPVTLRFRGGGERCQCAPRGVTHRVKKLFQALGVPPWLRDRVPLIWVGETLAAVADLHTCAPFHAATGETGIACVWEPDPRFFRGSWLRKGRAA